MFYVVCVCKKYNIGQLITSVETVPFTPGLHVMLTGEHIKSKHYVR
jgi:hypothetical protein